MMENIFPDLKKISTTSISDAMDYFKIDGTISIFPIENGMKCSGRAFTVKFTDDDLGCEPTANYPQELSENDIIVIDNQGKNYCTVWGEMLTLSAISSKANGVIINGCCRDVSEIINLSFPTFSLSKYMRTGKSRVKVESLKKEITIDGITISHGDIICADDNGVIVIPKDIAYKVAELAFKIDENDKKITDLILSGKSLKEAKDIYNYDNFAKKIMSCDK